MAIALTTQYHTFLDWRNNTNSTANAVGDVATLDLSPIGIMTPPTNTVAAINAVAGATATAGESAALVYAIALG